MKLFRVDTGGANYHVAARRAEDCAQLIEDCEGCAMDEMCGDGAPEITEVAEDRARAVRVNEDGEPGQKSLWAVFQEAVEKGVPAVLCCSEWP